MGFRGGEWTGRPSNNQMGGPRRKRSHNKEIDFPGEKNDEEINPHHSDVIGGQSAIMKHGGREGEGSRCGRTVFRDKETPVSVFIFRGK